MAVAETFGDVTKESFYHFDNLDRNDDHMSGKGIGWIHNHRKHKELHQLQGFGKFSGRLYQHAGDQLTGGRVGRVSLNDHLTTSG